MGKKLAQSLIISNILDYFPITEKHSAAQVRAPKNSWGKKIGDLKIREKYGISILEIRKISEKGNKIERINYLLKATDTIEKKDVLTVIGEEEDIERFSKE